MWRSFFFVWLASLLLLATAFVPSLPAQDVKVERVNSIKSSADESSDSGERTPAMQYFAAAVLSTVVLFVVCAPSRKGYMQSGDKDA
jgi:hypothetical protein